MGVLCSIAADVDSFATALREGCSGIAADPWGEDGPPFGALIRGFELENALAGRHLPASLLQRALRAARRAPFAIQVATATALEAWERARMHEAAPPPERIGIVVAGNNLTSNYADTQRAAFERNRAYLAGRFALHFQDTDHVGTLSEILGIRGEGFTVGGASASGNLGIIQGSRLIEWGEVGACVVIGAMTDLSAMEMQAFLNIGAMAARLPDQNGRTAGPPFDRKRRGFVPGQGCACLILESHTSAEQRGVEPLAEISGHAAKLDGNRLADPSESGEVEVIARAIARAGLEPRDIAYVNTHGSGSTLGDETELASLRHVFGDSYGVPWVNATKSLTGHCLSAAGVLEAAATIAQMQEQLIHPNVGLEDPIDAECRFAGARATRAAIPFALSNSFGFGGINTSIVLAHPRGRAT
jgi:malonyl-ACP decarboxylase